MSESNFIARSSRRYRETSRTDSGDTPRKAGRKPSPWRTPPAAPNFALTASKIAFGSKQVPLRLRREISLLLDDLLELEDAVDERLGAGGAAGGVGVGRGVARKTARSGSRSYREAPVCISSMPQQAVANRRYQREDFRHQLMNLSALPTITCTSGPRDTGPTAGAGPLCAGSWLICLPSGGGFPGRCAPIRGPRPSTGRPGPRAG